MDNLIPKPASLLPSNGSFKITNETRIITPENAEIAQTRRAFAEHIRKYAGLELETKSGDTSLKNNTIELFLTSNAPYGEEGYELSISSDGIVLRANHPAGLFYGTQTLIQLLGTLPYG